MPISRRERAILQHGPNSGEVYRVRPGESEVRVLEEVPLVAAFAEDAGDLRPTTIAPRIGIYRRCRGVVGEDGYFEWVGWR